MEITAPAQWINQTFAGFDISVTTAVHKLYDIGGAFFTPFFEGIYKAVQTHGGKVVYNDTYILKTVRKP